MTASKRERSRPAGLEPPAASLSGWARAVLVAVGLVLLVPVVAMRGQTDDQLEAFHNRVLTQWPRRDSFWPNPSAYFSTVNAWLADRAYPIIAVTYLKNDFLYFGLNTAPMPHITIARDRFVFLNGNDDTSVNDMIEGTCLGLSNPSEMARLQAAVDEIADYGRHHADEIDVVLVPTIPTLYGDRLPRSIPSADRAACSKLSRGDSPLAQIASPRGTRFSYSFSAMHDHRDDRAFFPIGNFHPGGWSVKVARDAFLHDIGAAAPTGETVELTTGPSELLLDHGVVAPFPVYKVSASGITVDGKLEAAVRADTVRFYDNPLDSLHAYRNPRATDPESLLMISDSFGEGAGLSYAAAFQQVVQIGVPERDVSGLVATIAKLTRFDRVVLLFNEGNYGSVIEIGRLLRSDMSTAASK